MTFLARFVGFRTAFASIVLAAGMLSGPASAQSDDAAKREMEVAARAESAKSLVTLKFKGGTLAEYVKALSATGRFNIVLRPQAENVRVPAVELTHADADAAIKILNGLSAPDSPGEFVQVIPNAGNHEPGSMPVYVVDIAQSGATRQSQRVKSSTLVENIADLVESGLKSDDVLQAIETAITMFNEGGAKPDIRFHEPTGLIIARGNIEHMDAISMVITGLRGSPALNRKKADAEWQAAAAKMEHDRNSLAEEIQQMRNEYDRMNRERTEAAVRLEATMVEVERLRQQLKIREDVIEDSHHHARALQEQIEQTRREAERRITEAAKEAEAAAKKRD
jgi:hypothetical protein